MSETLNSGNCPRCNSVNPYAAAACFNCGARLPWADAVDAAKKAAAIQAEAEQAKRLEVAKAEAKAAKEISKTTPITQRQSSPVTAVLVWIIALGLVGYIAWGFISVGREDATVGRDLTDERRIGNTPSSSNVTLSAYNQLYTGMSQSEAIAILGPPDSSMTLDIGGVSTLTYRWTGSGAVISASFQNGKLGAKSQSGL